MSDVYTEFIAEPTSTKNILVEVDVGIVQTTWLTYEPNIFQWVVTNFGEDTVFNFGNGSFGYGSFGFGGTADTGTEAEIFNVGSVIVNGIPYTKVTSLATLRATDSAFMYVPSTTLLLVHFEDSKWPEQFGGAIKLGITEGFALQIPGVYNNTEYEPRVLSIPSFQESVDPLVFGILSFNTGTIELQDTDSELKRWITNTPIGSEVRIKFGGDDLEYADYTTILTSRVKDLQMTERTVSLNISDTRESLSTPLPQNIFDVVTYPNISDNNRNKSIPLGYGVIRNAPAVCTNEAEPGPPANYNFKLVDTAFHGIDEITTVLVEGVDKTAQKTDNLADGSFTLPNAHYTAGDEVTVGFTGYTDGSVIDNALDVIKDLLLNYTPALFTTDFFNVTEWNVSTLLVNDISILIEDEKLIDIIEEICNTVQGSFKVESEGTYTFKLHNTAKSPVKNIKKQEILGEITVEYRSNEYVSSARIKYNQDWESNAFREILSDDDELTQLTKYNFDSRRTYETLLTTEDNANNLGRAIVLRNKDIIPVFTITTKTQNINLSVFDTVNVEMNKSDVIWFGDVKCEVIGINTNFNSFTTELTLRFIQDIIEPTVVNNPVGSLFYGEGKTAEKITGFYGSGIFGGFYQNPSAEAA